MTDEITPTDALSAPFSTDSLAVYRSPGDYIDSDHPSVAAAARRLRGDTDHETARQVFDFVRELRYEGEDFESLETYRASHILDVRHGYCVGKASVCVALARANGIPARIAFADVRNHLASPRLLEAMGTDTFAWHGYAELHLDERWVKVSPTFDTTTCQRAGVAPLEFDGHNDALLQSFDGDRTMDYVKVHGSFHDVPARFLAEEMLRLYPFFRDRGVTRYKETHGS